MPTKKDPVEAADEVVARGQDEVTAELARRASPRDALLDPQPTDIIPDNDEKGYHVGEVRQPAEPVLTRGGDVRFESIADQPSKFEDNPSSLKALKAAHNEREASDAAYAGITHVPDEDPALARPEAPQTSKAARAAAREAAEDKE